MNDQQRAAMQMAYDLLCRPVDTIAEMYCFGMGDGDETTAALRKALNNSQVVNDKNNLHVVNEQPQGEPVAWFDTNKNDVRWREGLVNADFYDGQPFYTTPPSVEAAIEEANRRQNASWKLMCEKMVAIEREKAAKVLDKQIVKLKQVLDCCEADEADAIKSTAWQLSVLAAAIRSMK